jgi:gentisate 1,2-dioxygenase
MRIQQPDDTPLFTREPQARMKPMHWKWSNIVGSLDELTSHISLDGGSARRTLKLANPGLEYGTTPTYWVSIQYILPGEVASAHRHTPEAFRFVISGSGCSTTVGGENYDMNEGDLVLTPSWAWHDHTHQGSEPMIWMEVLDISLVRSFDSIFFEDYTDELQPISATPRRSYAEWGSGILRPAGAPSPQGGNPLLAYPRAQAEAAITAASELPSDAENDVILEYQNPASGGPAMYTMSMKTQLIRPGFDGALHRELGSKVYQVIEGSGITTVNDQEIRWEKGDLFAIPSWAAHKHANTSDTPARLFRVDDSPVLRAMGIYRSETLAEAVTPAAVSG